MSRYADKERYEEEYEGFNIRQLDGQLGHMYEIKPVGQGRMPDVLVGMYTSLNKAKESVDIWTRLKKPRIKKNLEDGEN